MYLAVSLWKEKPNKLIPVGKYQRVRMIMVTCNSALGLCPALCWVFCRHYFMEPSQPYEVLIRRNET
jgi:hypothetical protein